MAIHSLAARPRALAATTLLAFALAACGAADATPTPAGGSQAGNPTPAATTPAAQPIHWTYAGEEGPDHWGELDATYQACKTGRQQSPIDIHQPAAQDLADISFSYQPAAVKVLNNGHTIQAAPAAAGSFIELDGKRYDLAQFHFHDPSEHTVEGKPFPMELHLVHKAADGSLAVVGVLIEEGAANTTLAPVFAHMPATANATEEVADEIDFNALIPSSHLYYHYAGSLTTPPCTEGVNWLVLKEPIAVSAEQLNAFKQLIGANSRPVQQLEGRTLEVDTASK